MDEANRSVRIDRVLLAIGIALVAGFLVVGRVQAQLKDDPVAPLGWDSCSVDLDGLPPDHGRAAHALMAPAYPVAGYGLRTSYALARQTFAEQGHIRVSPDLLEQYEVPLWRVEPVDWTQSLAAPLSLTHGINACLPYPVKSISTMATSVVRGQTLIVEIETDRLAFCRYTFLGQTDRCYREGNTGLYILVGTSALMAPGDYSLDIELISGGAEVAFSLPIVVTPGRYGFQYINPPASLSWLMDPGAMDAEAAYLAQWRQLRSPSRHWELPLALPLATVVPVSAAYGDRRSYGGMVDGYHSGVDYRAWGGMNVIAPADGTVVMVDSLAVRGNAVLIDHGWGLVTGYWHLSAVHVRPGDLVSRGDVFAQVGSTGLSTGAHLHWEVWVNGVSVDGQQWLDAGRFAGVEIGPFESWPLTTGVE